MQKLKAYVALPEVFQQFVDVMGTDFAPGFIVTMLNYCEKDAKLLKCDPKSIVNSFLIAGALNLSFDKSLNECYVSAIKDGKVFAATFNVTYRGLYQLCIRSDKYESIEVDKVVEGELIHQDRMTGDKTFDWVQDNDLRNTMKVVGYMSYFKLMSGLRKSLYMSVTELETHGKTYSDNYAEKWAGDKFDAMSRKTVMKLLLHKFGAKSAEMTKAIKYDQATVNDAGQPEYIDNKGVVVLSSEDKLARMISLFEEKGKKVKSADFKHYQRIIDGKEASSYDKAIALLEAVKV